MPADTRIRTTVSSRSQAMEITAEVPRLREWVAARRYAGDRIALVPTMGFLHEGHLALVDEARRRTGCVVLSSFVNPLQFGPDEDLDRYPRDDERDRQLAEGRGVDLLFQPSATTMYPAGSEIRVVPGPAGRDYEGTSRPGHFEGVLTVVAKLFHLVAPDVACFGQKDIQQATLVRQMVRDLDWRVELAVVPTVRDPDGLALSSRNAYLAGSDKAAALGLSAALAEAHEAWLDGTAEAAAIVARMRRVLQGVAGLQIEYIAVVDPNGFQPVSAVDENTIVALAGRVGRTRLIDNIVLGRGLA